MDNERADYIADLRQIADWLEQHPNVPLPNTMALNCLMMRREDFGPASRGSGPWEKAATESFFVLRHKFQVMSVDLYAYRGKVCERVVVGKKVIPAQPEREEDIVEWHCPESILADSIEKETSDA